MKMDRQNELRNIDIVADYLLQHYEDIGNRVIRRQLLEILGWDNTPDNIRELLRIWRRVIDLSTRARINRDGGPIQHLQERYFDELRREMNPVREHVELEPARIERRNLPPFGVDE